MLPEVFAIAATDAAQGAYSRQKTRKENADSGVKICASIIGRVRPFIPELLPAQTPSARTVNVLTTASLADRPVINAAAARQSPKPRGAKIGEASFPASAKRLSSGLAAGVSPML